MQMRVAGRSMHAARSTGGGPRPRRREEGTMTVKFHDTPAAPPPVPPLPAFEPDRNGKQRQTADVLPSPQPSPKGAEEPRKRTVIICDGAIGGARHHPLYEPYFSDPDAELWGMNMLFTAAPWWTRWFELHVDYLIDAPVLYQQFLARDHDRPIYMLRREPTVPSSVAFPLADVVRDVSGAYFTSTRAYMLALAVYERFERIVCIGTGEKQPERSLRSTRNVAFWLGVAAGRGIEIVQDVGEGALVSYAGDDAGLLYGYRMTLEDACDPAQVDARRESVERRRAMARFDLATVEDARLGR